MSTLRRERSLWPCPVDKSECQPGRGTARSGLLDGDRELLGEAEHHPVADLAESQVDIIAHWQCFRAAVLELQCGGALLLIDGRDRAGDLSCRIPCVRKDDNVPCYGTST